MDLLPFMGKVVLPIKQCNKHGPFFHISYDGADPFL
jgi:hypothetical protein